METLTYIIVILLVIVAIQYLRFNLKQKDSSSSNYQKDRESINENQSAEVGKKPQQLDEPTDGKKDNLLLIKGLGKVSQSVLHKNGIYYFDQIANFTEDEIKWIEKAISFPGRVERDDWIGQAKSLSRGEDTEYSKKVNSN